MRLLSRMRSWTRSVLHRSKLERELEDELRFHVDQYGEDLIRTGVPAPEARRRARIEFGAMQARKEECREAVGLRLLDEVAGDLRYAFRQLRGTPAFTTAAVLSLALGIGANTAIFTLLDALMWRALPVKDPESLLVVGRSRGADVLTGFTYPQFDAMRANRDVVELAAYSSADFAVRVTVADHGRPEPPIDAQLVTGNFFSLLGILPRVGRLIGPDDDRTLNGHPVAVLAHGYWERRFGADPSVVGRTLSIANTPFTVIGVTPREFTGVDVGLSPDVFIPTMMQAIVMPVVGDVVVNQTLYRTWLQTLARLAPGVDARRAASAIEPAYQRNVPPAFQGKAGPDERIVLRSAATGLSDVRQQFSSSLLILMAIVAIVLLIGCANTANLLLARAAARRPEFALRLALGAGRGRLLRQVLVEGLLLAAIAGLCGMLVARYATSILLAYASTGRTPIALNVSPDIRVLFFTAAVSMMTGILFALAPALRMSRVDLVSAGKKAGGAPGFTPRKGLVAVQVALSLILLVAAGLFVRSLGKINAQDGGVDRERVLLVRVEPHGSNQRGTPGVSERLDRTYRDLMARVEAIPGVRAVSMSNVSPTKPDSGAGGPRVDRRSGQSLPVPTQTVYARYFETLGIPLVAGRDFSDGEAANSPVCIVNETFARIFYPAENPLGRSCSVGARTRAPRSASIVGVVSDSRYTNLREPQQPVVYMPFLSSPTGRGQMILYVRVAGDPDGVAGRVRDEVWNADATVPQYTVRTLSDELDAVLIRERLLATVSSFFGALGLLLTAIGLYGLLSYVIVQRSAELAIRIALGADRGRLVWTVTREALGLVLTGAAAAAPAVWVIGRLASRLLSTVLFGLAPSDPVVLVVATLTLTLVGAMAAALPAWRAATVDPMVALRHE
jgi:predicted permease